MQNTLLQNTPEGCLWPDEPISERARRMANVCYQTRSNQRSMRRTVRFLHWLEYLTKFQYA